MKLALELAFKNCIKSGVRTWLNAGILSFAFILILFFNGLMDGWNEETKKETIAWEYGEGQIWSKKYDPLDPFSLKNSVTEMPEELKGVGTPILIQQGSIYPQQRFIPVQLKGIDLEQHILKIPTEILAQSKAEIPVLIGKRMAKTTQLKVNDQVLLRWRDTHGVYDAKQLTVVGIFDTNVGGIDNGQLWMSLKTLQKMTRLENKATIWIANNKQVKYRVAGLKAWKFVGLKELLKDIEEMVEIKKSSNAIFYLMLLSIALLAIFDTQVLSIFRRQKEIATYLALGLTKTKVMLIFTLEGVMYSFLAILLGAAYGIPLLWYLQKKGLYIPNSDDLGMAMADRIYPYYTVDLIIQTILLIVISATIVSYLPARKIAKLNPVNALKGKLL